MITSGSKSRISSDLPLGHPAGDRDDRAPEPLGAGVGPEAAGEQAVAVGVVHAVARADAGRADRAGDEQRPGVEVVSRRADDRRPTGRAGRGVDPDDLARAARRTSRTGTARAGRPWSVNGNRARSASSRQSSGCTPAASNARRVCSTCSYAWCSDQRSRSSCSARSSSIDARSIGSSASTVGRRSSMVPPDRSPWRRPSWPTPGGPRWTPPTDTRGMGSEHASRTRPRSGARHRGPRPAAAGGDRPRRVRLRPARRHVVDQQHRLRHRRRRRRRHRQLRHGAPHAGLPRVARQRLVAADPRARQHPPPRRPHPRQLPHPPGDDRRPHRAAGSWSSRPGSATTTACSSRPTGATSSWPRRC